MSKDQFEDTLRRFLRRRPFIPFVIELIDGERIDVDHPGVAFNEGSGCYLSSSFDLFEFDCDGVREIHLVNTETSQ